MLESVFFGWLCCWSCPPWRPPAATFVKLCRYAWDAEPVPSVSPSEDGNFSWVLVCLGTACPVTCWFGKNGSKPIPAATAVGAGVWWDTVESTINRKNCYRTEHWFTTWKALRFMLIFATNYWNILTYYILYKLTEYMCMPYCSPFIHQFWKKILLVICPKNGILNDSSHLIFLCPKHPMLMSLRCTIIFSLITN